ncbi:MAG TPA: uroporphyrinogen-III decarboxylase-like protein [Armatimonadetes bacterium]|nr:uroporphyrinogen-III decarboxylase-like protein [Armatimonadota bacterium]
MTRKEIVCAALEHRETPTVPYHLDFAPPVGEDLQQYFGTSDLDRALGNYLYWLSPRPSLDFQGRRLKGPLVEDEFGVVWDKRPENRGYPVRHPLARPDLSGYTFPDPFAAGRFAAFPAQIEAHRDLFLVAWCGDLFERAHFLRGLGPLLLDFYEHPQFVHDLLDGILEFNLGLVRQLARFPLDGLFLSDDYGSQHGPLMSLAHWREFLRPRLQRLFAQVKGYGLRMFLHSCGNVEPFLPDLIDLGLDVLHPVQPEAMDLRTLKKRYGERLTLYGGLSTQRLLPRASPAQVQEAVRETVRCLAQGGGYILGPGITIQHDIPRENILAVLQAVREWVTG